MNSTIKFLIFILFTQLSFFAFAAPRNIVQYCMDNQNNFKSVSAEDRKNFNTFTEKIKEYKSNPNEKIKSEDAAVFKISSYIYSLSVKTAKSCEKRYLELHQMTLSPPAEPKVAIMYGVIRQSLAERIDLIEELIRNFEKNDANLITTTITIGEWESNNNNIIISFNKKENEQATEFKNAYEEVKLGRTPKFGKIFKQRELAKNDAIAQVLNYSTGLAEDSSDAMFFYPENTDNGQCIYKISSTAGSLTAELTDKLSQANNFISSLGIPELNNATRAKSAIDEGIDLNKGDLKNINFYKLQGANRNKFTGVTAYLRYQTRVEGLPDIFECDSNTCNVDRLKRGWTLIQNKCKGTVKAF